MQGQKLLHSTDKLVTDAFIKTASIRAFEKTAEVTNDLVGNKIADKSTSIALQKVDEGACMPKMPAQKDETSM